MNNTNANTTASYFYSVNEKKILTFTDSKYKLISLNDFSINKIINIIESILADKNNKLEIFLDKELTSSEVEEYIDFLYELENENYKERETQYV